MKLTPKNEKKNKRREKGEESKYIRIYGCDGGEVHIDSRS